MKVIKYLSFLFIGSLLFTSCTPDDDDNTIVVRDPQEVYDENLAQITTYLETHYYKEEEYQNVPDGEDFQIEFFEIDEESADRTPLSQQVTTTTLTRNDVDYQVFILKVREGGGDIQPTFADSVLVNYQGRLLDDTLDGMPFDRSTNSLWFNLPGAIAGFTVAFEEFKGSTDIIPNGDGTLSYKNGGIGAVFIPSGLAYFNAPPSGSRIPPYAPLSFTFQLRKVKRTDHDGDGILSVYEDLDGDKNLNSPNFRDNTDEDFTTGANGRRFPLNDYNDADDDNDGILTKDENPDPNGDGNPDDAKDSDGDGIPDYLDNRTES